MKHTCYVGEEFGEKRGISNKHSIKPIVNGQQVRVLDLHEDKGVLYDKIGIKAANDKGLRMDQVPIGREKAILQAFRGAEKVKESG